MKRIANAVSICFVFVIGALAVRTYDELGVETTRYRGNAKVVDLFHTAETLQVYTTHGPNGSPQSHSREVPEAWATTVVMNGKKISAGADRSVWYRLKVGNEVELWETRGPVFSHGYSVRFIPQRSADDSEEKQN